MNKKTEKENMKKPSVKKFNMNSSFDGHREQIFKKKIFLKKSNTRGLDSTTHNNFSYKLVNPLILEEVSEFNLKFKRFLKHAKNK